MDRSALKTPNVVCVDSVEECATWMCFIYRSLHRGRCDEDASMLHDV
jgi:hypothetical protein